MGCSLIILALLAVMAVSLYHFIVFPLCVSPLAHIPGPKAFALTKWRLALEEWQGMRTYTIHKLHQRYGSAVRIGPNEVHFNSLSALRTIYGAGSGFERTTFYRMFDVYGKQNLFTFHSVKEHGERKKLLARAYSKSSMQKGVTAEMVGEKVEQYLDLIKAHENENEIFNSLHYYSLDNITFFLYGPQFGGTSALTGAERSRALLDDILNPARRKLSWWATHFPGFTRWLYTRTGLMESIIGPWLPMRKPATYTGIRAHALKAMKDFSSASLDAKEKSATKCSIIAHLWKHHYNEKPDGLDDLEIASECADHLLAGVDTTSDTLMFLIWALSLPENEEYQKKLVLEAQKIPESMLDSKGNPTVEVIDKLPYLEAVIKETLRLYAPLPASEPRSLSVNTIVDGHNIPAGTVVAMSPYSLHRNAQVFPDPLRFDPERWLSDSAKLVEMKRWWWPFSSGGRMCIGLHLALAEMTLVPAIYRKYTTWVKPDFKGISPGITSRFEVFYDERFERMEEHTCWIQFREQ